MLQIILNRRPIDLEGNRSKVKVTQGENLANFGLISPFPDHNSSFNSFIATIGYGKLQIVLNR